MENSNKTGKAEFPPELVESIRRDLKRNLKERTSAAIDKFLEEEAEKIGRGEKSEFSEFLYKEIRVADMKAGRQIVKEYRERGLKGRNHKVKIIGITSCGDPVIKV